MKRNTRSLKKVVLLATFASSFVLGCELIVDFDRTRIPVEGGDATTADVVAPPADTGTPETSTTTDAAPDAPTDAGSNADADAEADADAS
jgi:hypothetical protein